MKFSGSADYWEQRYGRGDNSGKGSYGELAEFKAEVLNDFVAENRIESVIEFGCGDGNQLSLAEYPVYTGLDVSTTAVDICRKSFDGDASKSFALVSEYDGQQAELAMSLDVIFHLVEDEVFEDYMRRLFSASSKYVVIYCSNFDSPPRAASRHVRHREFTQWVERNIDGFRLLHKIENRYSGLHRTSEGHGSPSDFYFYKRD